MIEVFVLVLFLSGFPRHVGNNVLYNSREDCLLDKVFMETTFEMHDKAELVCVEINRP